VIGWLISLLNPLEKIGEQLNDAYRTKVLAQGTEQKLEADMQISQLEARRDILLAEQSNKLTRWIRPALAFPVVVFWFKLIVYDTVLGLGVTPDPGEVVMWYCMLIPTAYFVTRPIEKFVRRRR